MSKHTKEPWVQGDCSRNMIYAWKGQVLVFTDDGYRIIVSCNQNYPEEAEANARRIVACVNACAGMDDPEKEVATLKVHRDELLAERDKLLFHESQLVESLKSYMNKYGPGYSCTDTLAYDNATGVLAAIANVEKHGA